MKAKTLLVLAAAAAFAWVAIVLYRTPSRPLTVETGQAASGRAPASSGADLQTPAQKAQPTDLPGAARGSQPSSSFSVTDQLAGMTDKLDRLAFIRTAFGELGKDAPRTALAQAKQIKDPTEREAALFTLVSQWTHGELRTPAERAQSIDQYGLEAGLGIELAKLPDLARTWADEMTEGPGRSAVLRATAASMLETDPSSAFAISQLVPEEERGAFVNTLFANWAQSDTLRALDSANQISDPAQRDAALNAIHSVAPVGIGTELRVEEGYTIINRLLPGMPADLSGQLHQGDRIVALAQGDSSFVNARDLPLQDIVQMIRGAPGTVLQLQVASPDAPADALPRTVSIVRDQVTFKR